MQRGNAGSKPVVLLDRWMLARSRIRPDERVLFGFAYRHPRLREGRAIHTSLIVDIDMKRRRVETLNTVYRLLRAASDDEDLGFPWSWFFERVDPDGGD